MPKKKCMKCGELKPLSAFYRHPRMKDGHLNKCIDCAKKDVKNHKKNNPESVFKTRLKVFKKKKTRTSMYKLMDAALKAGKLVNPGVCSICGTTADKHRIEAHHENYDEPLKVIWCCTPCHRKLDAKRRVLEGLKPYGSSKYIIAYNQKGDKIAEFYSVKEAAEYAGIGRSTMSTSIKNRIQRNGLLYKEA